MVPKKVRPCNLPEFLKAIIESCVCVWGEPHLVPWHELDLTGPVSSPVNIFKAFICHLNIRK